MKRSRATAFGSRVDKPRKTRITGRTSQSLRVVPGYTRTGGAYARSVRRLPGQIPQKKYMDWAPSLVTIPTANLTVLGTNTAANQGVNLVPQGTTDITRVGNKINICNIDLHYALSMADDTVAGAIENANVRLMFILDKQANGSVPTGSDILNNGTSIADFRNMDTVDRFQILWDKNFTLQPTAAIYDGTNMHTSTGAFGWRKKRWAKLSVPIHFSNTTGAIAEVKSNNFILMGITDLANAKISFKFRIKYYDA